MTRRRDEIGYRYQRSGRNHRPNEWEELVSYVRSPFFRLHVEWIARCRGEHVFGAPRRHHDAVWAVAWWLKDGRSADKVIAMLRQPDTWEGILRELRAVFPEEVLLRPGTQAPSRDIFRHMNDRITSADIMELEAILFESAVWFAKEMGLGVNDGDWLEPSTSAALTGDLLAIRAMSSFGPTDYGFNRRTGKFQLRRHSRNAHVHVSGDKREMFGHTFAHLSSRTGNSLEEITFSVRPVGKTQKAINNETEPDTEASAIVSLAERVQRAVGGFAMLHYDKAIRGEAVESVWQIGLHPLIGIYNKSGLRTERIPLGEYKLKRNKRMIKVTAWQGAVCITGTNGRLVKLDAASIYKREKKGGITVYAVYRIPDGTNCNTEFWGDEFRVPMSGISGAKLCRAEHLRPLAPGGVKWGKMYGRRSAAESLNSLIQDNTLKGSRARSNDPARVWMDTLRLVFRKNYRAHMVYCRRRTDSGPPLAA